jgi:PhzF family phenazine biosynthesis protein
MKTVKLSQVDAFTDRLFGGNPAGVVFEADFLTDDEMKNIAHEMNLSDTAFILKPTSKNADVKLRYFTSGKAEIKFCGHATVGALCEIARLGIFGMKGAANHKLKVETNAGVLPMEIVKKSDSDITIRFTAPKVELANYKSQGQEFSDRLVIPIEAVDTRYPIMIDSTLNYIYFAIKSLEELGKLEFNFQRIIDNFKSEGIVIFCLITPETFDKENTIHARGLAPLVGIPEDPFTGSMQAGLATYARENKIVPETLSEVCTEQGHFIGRPGFAIIDLPSPNRPSYIISGKAIHVFSGEISL